MEDPRSYEARKADEYRKAYEAREAANALQEAKLKALQDTFGNYGDFRYVDLDDFLDPDNQNWNDYSYKISSPLVGLKGRVGAASPIGMFIKHIRDAKNTDDVKKQLELWDSYKPLDLPHNGESYVNHFIYGLNNAPGTKYGGSAPVFPTENESNPGGTGGAQGVVTVGGAQGAQAGNTGGISTGGGTASTQGAQVGAQTGGTGGTQGMKAGSTGTGGTYASAGVPKGGTKTIGYDPNPGNVSLAYAMRNAPEPARRGALIDKWDREHGRSGSTYASPSISTGGVVSPATMMRTSGVQPVQAAYGNNAPMGEGFDYTRTYDPMSNSMRPNNSYSYYDPSRNAPSGGDGTDLTLTYDPMTGQLVRR